MLLVHTVSSALFGEINLRCQIISTSLLTTTTTATHGFGTVAKCETSFYTKQKVFSTLI